MGLGGGGAGVQAGGLRWIAGTRWRITGTRWLVWLRWVGWWRRWRQIRLAHAIDPISSIISRDIALLYYYYQRNYDLALEQCDRAIEQNPHFAPVYWTLGLVQEQRGDFDEAVAAFQRAIELSPPSPRILGALGGVYAKHGKKEQAIDILAELQELSLSRYISPFERALIHFNLGRKDEGFALLTKAFEDRCVELISIHLDPRFDVVRNDLRFKTLVRRLGLPQGS